MIHIWETSHNSDIKFMPIEATLLICQCQCQGNVINTFIKYYVIPGFTVPLPPPKEDILETIIKHA